MSDLKRSTAHNVIRYTGNPLDVMFSPRSVAVVGATEREGSIGRIVIRNLLRTSFGGTIFPVNPKWHSVLGLKAYARLAEVPDEIDLVVIATPARTVPDLVRECVEAGVKACIILSAGFKEAGPQGAALEQEILQDARRGRMRVVGPNCLGIMHTYSGLNASFAARLPNPGSVGFVSQSGALCSAVLDWSFRENVGFSAFVSIGSMLDVGWGDLIYYFGDDPQTKSIVIYMETIGDARAFLSAAREVALTKPIIVIKPGRSQEAAKAAASHTGSIAGNDEALAAAFRRCGVLRVNQIEDLFNMAEALAKQPRPTGPRLSIVTNAGGPGVLATDALITSGGELAPISIDLMATLNEILPEHWSHGNPIDILGDADPQRYSRVIEMMSNDSKSDGMLVILTPQAMADPTQTAHALNKIYNRPAGYAFGKPILASWMGGDQVAEGEAILNQANIPTFAFPDAAARSFNYMWRSQKRLQSLYETPHLPSGFDETSFKRFLTSEMIDDVRQTGRTILTEFESKRILEAYGIPTVETVRAHSATEAAKKSGEIGFPVVLKLNSETITHKSEVGGVYLGLENEDEVLRAFLQMEQEVTAKYRPVEFQGVTVQPMLDRERGYELIAGSSPDSQLGPVLLFGAGGALVEVFADHALGIPPLNTTLARRLMERTKIYNAMVGEHARLSIDINALQELLVLFSQLVVQQRWIKEIEINPLFASATGLVALDAQIELYGIDIQEQDLPQLAIRPYPTQYVRSFINKAGESYIIRPVRPEDEPLVVNFHAKLSEESVYFRYFRAFQLSQRVEHERLTRVCHVDYDRTIALVTEWENPAIGESEIVAIGRLT
ncbi:MAG: acetyl CoA synthetase subunit alpha, partial [Chloroflexi bacterium]|nr:acetyl CoA synthetase subunit alpha [Chloroflexota bacterium]